MLLTISPHSAAFVPNQKRLQSSLQNNYGSTLGSSQMSAMTYLMYLLDRVSYVQTITLQNTVESLTETSFSSRCRHLTVTLSSNIWNKPCKKQEVHSWSWCETQTPLPLTTQRPIYSISGEMRQGKHKLTNSRLLVVQSFLQCQSSLTLSRFSQRNNQILCQSW